MNPFFIASLYVIGRFSLLNNRNGSLLSIPNHPLEVNASETAWEVFALPGVNKLKKPYLSDAFKYICLVLKP